MIEKANAVIDIDINDPSALICDLTMKEKSRLTASIGASHDVNSMSQLNGSLSVGVRNLFGNAEKLDLSADLGLGTTNQSSLSLSRKNSNNMFDGERENNDDLSATSVQSHSNSIYNIVHNTSNQYSITFSKPRINLPFNISNLTNDIMNKKSSLMVRGFQQKLDRTRSSSYREDSLGTTASLISYNKQHCLSYNYHLRSLIPTFAIDKTMGDNVDINNNVGGGMVEEINGISSPTIADESTMMSAKSSLNYRYVKDTRNHPSIPSAGYLMTAETEIAGFGGDVDFIKTCGSVYYHWSMPRITTNVDPPDLTTKLSSILNIGIQTGFVIPWKRKLYSRVATRQGGNNNGNGNDDGYGDKHIRIIDRLIPMGGLQLRGFEHGQIGPRDRNDYVHCDFLLAGGLSLCVPIFEWLYGNIFINASHCNLLRNTNSISDIVNEGVASAGLSCVVPFPVGRLEIGYAYPLKVKDNPFSPWFWAFDVQFF